MTYPVPRMAASSDRPAAPSDAARALQARAHRAIPGGSHTYAKGDDQFPANAPPLLVRGQGARVWDTDGNEYVEYGGGLRANVLGHARPEVVEAVQRAATLGTNFVRPAVVELQAAEDLLDFVGRPDWMAKFTKNGSDANAAAIRLARAVTGRDRVAYCRSQPFFSVDDWFIGTTPMDAGIPSAATRLVEAFDYGDLAGLDLLLDGREVAAIVMEAAKYADPPAGWLDGVRALCDRTGTLLILDEMITGLRWPGRTAMQHYGIDPDLATYGKALGNGFAVSALIGRAAHMQLGGLDHDGDRVFLLSYTHGAEHTGLAAAQAVMACIRKEDAGVVLADRGTALADALRCVSRDAGVADHLTVVGPGQNLVFGTADAAGEPSQEMRALFMQELVRGGVLGPSLVNSVAHGAVEHEITVAAWATAAMSYARALESGPRAFLVGPPTKPVFRRRN